MLRPPSRFSSSAQSFLTFVRTRSWSRVLVPETSTIHPHYKSFIFWSTASNLAVSMQNVIVTHSMLDSIGPSNETFRTLNFVSKDVIGQLGSLYYISKHTKDLDRDPLSFVRTCHVTQQCAYVASSVTYLLPVKTFIAIGGLTTLLFNVSFVGYGAINTKCMQEFAREHNNIGEVYAKMALVNTVTSSVGMMLGMLVIGCVDRVLHPAVVIVLGAVRVYTFQRSIAFLTNKA